MSRAEEAAHLGVINNSLRDHRHYTEKGRVAEERNHRTSAEREEGEEAGGNKTQLWKTLVDISRITTRVSKLLLLKLHYPLNSCHPKRKSCQLVIIRVLLWNNLCGAVHESMSSCALTFLLLATI